MDAHLNTANDPSTSNKNLANFGPVIPEFCRSICTRWATCWALPRISSCLCLSRGHFVAIKDQAFPSLL